MGNLVVPIEVVQQGEWSVETPVISDTSVTLLWLILNDNSLIQKCFHFAQTTTWTGWHNILLPRLSWQGGGWADGGREGGRQSMAVLGIRFVLTRLNREITARSLSCGQTGHLAPLSQTVNTQHTRHSNVCICCHQPSNHPHQSDQLNTQNI